MKKAVLGLGGNIGDRLEYLRRAVRAIAQLPDTEVEAASSVYETAPWGYEQQASFYNMCLSVNTGLSPHALLGACLGIEAALGRVRTFQYAPRVIDIDVLLYEGTRIADAELTLPHKELMRRAFVLYPLAELGVGPQLGVDVDAALKNVADQKVRRMGVTIYSMDT